MARILVIDDEQLVRFALRELLEVDGHTVEEAENGEDGLRQISGTSYDLVITDIIMPLKEGAETIAQIKSVYPRLSVLAISGGTRVGANDILENATALGADDTLKKPFSDEAFLEKVSMLLTAGQ